MNDQPKSTDRLNVAMINMSAWGSTGKIMFGVADVVRADGGKAFTFSPRPVGKRKKHKFPKVDANHFYYGSYVENSAHHVWGIWTGCNCRLSRFATYRLIRRLKKLNPTTIHLHNLHSGYLHLGVLFNYFKKSGVPVVWTLHDCWAFTGQCAHFTAVKCDKWRSGCGGCPQLNVYPKSRVDRSKTMWRLKKEWFTGVENLTIATPSQWLADLAKESFLADCPVKVVNNGIDLDVFKPTESDFRRRFGFEGKFVVLGVSFGWTERKGFDVFLELAKRLDDRYRIVLVGTDEATEKALSDNVVSIRRTQNQRELAEIYAAADVFVNPTREETYPTVNMETLACGTPIVTFRTGGSPEILDATCGSVVDCDDVDAMEREVRRVCEEKPYSTEACLKRAAGFDAKAKFKEYVALYEEATRRK